MSTRVARRKSGRYVLGIDFGTLSARALLVDPESGEEVATAVHNYADGVIEEFLPGARQRLPPDTALQNPADYLEALEQVVPAVLRKARVPPEQVVGIGTDFTSCTLLPTQADGTPMCCVGQWRRNPHAWVKLWKHHSAQPEADEINRLAAKRDEPLLQAYGGRYSSEWFFSKLLETVRRAPAIYAAADRFIEAGDWIVWQLCGRERRCLSAAGFKAMRVCPPGTTIPTYPSTAFFKALHPRLEHVVRERLSDEYYPIGACAGELTQAMARRIGLIPGTPVATGNIDAHVAVPACGVTTAGKLVMILGTSTCHLLIGKERRRVEGACGVVADGIVPGAWGYEAGQAGVGDLFAWLVDHALPAYARDEARRRSLSPYEYLEELATALVPGESGMLALDWWNGCRSVLMDSDLSGLLMGATLGTRPHEVYRTFLEGTAFGTRKIIEAFTSQGVAINELYAAGGLARKSPLLLQIYADVTHRPIRLAASDQTCALGAAMQASVAAGVHPNIHVAAHRMAHLEKKTIHPNPKFRAIYGTLYNEYTRLHDYFGRSPEGSNGTMKVLKRLKLEARQASEIKRRKQKQNGR